MVKKLLFSSALLLLTVNAFAGIRHKGPNPAIFSTGSSLNVGITAAWLMDEESGARADAVNSYNLTDNNTVTFGAGVILNAASFASANSESLSIADDPVFDVGDEDFTLMGWINLVDTDNFRGIAAKMGAPGSEFNWQLYVNKNSDKFEFVWYTDAVETFVLVNSDTFGVLSDSTWYCFCIRHDSSADEISVAVNGGTFDSTATGGDYNTGNGSFYIGLAGSSLNLYMNGLIDLMHYYKGKVVTVAEWEEFYNSGAGNEYPF